MTIPADIPRLTSLSHGAGCACKLSLEELQKALAGLDLGAHPDLLVGVGTGDDAAVWRLGDRRTLVATTDFFTPLVDDPGDWGRIAATNAVSDVYAMGAQPLFALNLVGWPRDLPFEVLQEVLRGGLEVAHDAGYVVAGGHSIDSAEPLYGQVVIGECSESGLMTNAGASAGDALVLSKGLGTGIVTTAVKRSAPLTSQNSELGRAYAAALASMTLRNDRAAMVAGSAGAGAVTDVTGFGLLGHLHRLAMASGVSARVEHELVPVLPGAVELLDAGHVPGGTRRNADQSLAFTHGHVDERTRLLLADAQTSGGLLFACPPDAADEAVSTLQEHGHEAARIGEVVSGHPGSIEL